MVHLKSPLRDSACIAFANAASLTQVPHFGHNPTNATMYIYVPEKLSSHPTIIHGIHWYHGEAIDYCNGTKWASLANTKGFIVIYPNIPNSFDQCWDVASKQTLTHDSSGDLQTIDNIAKYTISKYRANRPKVLVTGVSSGAIVTNVVAAAYPRLFAARLAYSRVAARCFSGTQWAAVVKAMYRGYRGQYPRIQLWHGTADDVLDLIIEFIRGGERVDDDVESCSCVPDTLDELALERIYEGELWRERLEGILA